MSGDQVRDQVWPHLLLDDLVLLGLLGEALGGGLQVPQVDEPVQRAPGGAGCRGEVQGGGATEGARGRCKEKVQGRKEVQGGGARRRCKEKVQLGRVEVRR